MVGMSLAIGLALHLDAATAKGIRDEVGKVAKLSELTDPETIDKVYAAAKAALTKAEEEV